MFPSVFLANIPFSTENKDLHSGQNDFRADGRNEPRHREPYKLYCRGDRAHNSQLPRINIKLNWSFCPVLPQQANTQNIPS